MYVYVYIIICVYIYIYIYRYIHIIVLFDFGYLVLGGQHTTLGVTTERRGRDVSRESATGRDTFR